MFRGGNRSLKAESFGRHGTERCACDTAACGGGGFASALDSACLSGCACMPNMQHACCHIPKNEGISSPGSRFLNEAPGRVPPLPYSKSPPASRVCVFTVHRRCCSRFTRALERGTSHNNKKGGEGCGMVDFGELRRAVLEMCVCACVCV